MLQRGQSLKTRNMFIGTVEDDNGADLPPMKRVKSTDPTLVDKLIDIPLGEKRNKLFAVAEFKAEVARAESANRPVDLRVAHARFDRLRKGNRPMKVFVLWSSATSECSLVKEHVEEVPFAKLYRGRC